MKRAVAHQLRVVRLDDSRSLDVIHGKPTYVGRGVLGMTEPRLSRKASWLGCCQWSGWGTEMADLVRPASNC